MRQFAHRTDIEFRVPVPKDESGHIGIRRGIVNLARLVRGAMHIPRDGTLLFFSGAGFGFWEKCVWSIVVRLLKRRAAIVMVEGVFPQYFSSLQPTLKTLARIVCRGRRFKLGALSPSWQRYYQEAFPSAVVESVAVSVDAEFFMPRARALKEADALRVLFVGWIVESKGILDLLDAVRIVVRHSHRSFHLRLVGPLRGAERRWRSELEDRGLSGVVTLVGSVNNRAELLNEYWAADIFIFPSHFEAMPIALVEATSVGLPCIGTRVGGIPDILEEGSAGILVAAHDPEQLAHELQMLLEDESARVRLGNAAKRRALREHSPDACALSYLDFLGLERKPAL